MLQSLYRKYPSKSGRMLSVFGGRMLRHTQYPDMIINEEIVLAMTPSGTCSVAPAPDDRGRPKATIVNEAKFTDALKSVVKIQNKCLNQRMWDNMSASKNEYLDVGDCATFGMSKEGFDSGEIFQKLAATSALYKRSNGNDLFLYKNKSGLPIYLKGIFQKIGVFQYTDSYGRVQQIAEIKKVADFKDPALVKGMRIDFGN